jgi:hypothetical protein
MFTTYVVERVAICSDPGGNVSHHTFPIVFIPVEELGDEST